MKAENKFMIYLRQVSERGKDTHILNYCKYQMKPTNSNIHTNTCT